MIRLDARRVNRGLRYLPDPEYRSRRTNLLVFEQVNQLSQTAVVASVSQGASEWRAFLPAHSTTRFGCAFRDGMNAYQAFSAEIARSTCDGPHGGEALFTNRETGDV